MAQTPKAVRKNDKATATRDKAFDKMDKAVTKLKPNSPQKAKDSARSLLKKEDKAYARVQKTAGAARKIKMGK